MEKDQNAKRVAVIAVHGVADQEQCDSARAIAAMLLSLPIDEAQVRTYEPFRAETIHIPLSAPLRPTSAKAHIQNFRVAASADLKAHPRSHRERFAETFQESQPGMVATLIDSAPEYVAKTVDDEQKREEGWGTATSVPPLTRAPESAKKSEDAGLVFMRSLLSFYKQPADRRAYTTHRLVGKRGRRARAAGESRVECAVDVYELYWADLSRLGSGPVAFFGSMYQILLHFAELGRRALEDGLLEFSENPRWKRLLQVQTLATRQLDTSIPILNLVLFIAIAAAVVVRISGGALTTGAVSGNGSGMQLAAVAAMIALTVGACYAYISTKLPPGYQAWWIFPLGGVVVGGIFGYTAVTVGGKADVVLALECWAIGFALLRFVLRKYERVRPGAVYIGTRLYILAALLFLWALYTALLSDDGRHRYVEYASLWTLQMLNLVLSIFWIVLVVCAIWAMGAGFVLVRALRKNEEQQARARAAIRTSRLALSMSASGMVGLVTIVWAGLLAWGITSASAFECMKTTVFPPLNDVKWLIARPETLTHWLQLPIKATGCTDVDYSVQVYFREVLLLGTTSGFPISLLLMSLSILLLVWMALPSLRFEGASPSLCTNGESKRAGAWLSRGLDSTKIVAYLWWISVFVVFSLFAPGDLAERRQVLGESWLGHFFHNTAQIAFPVLNRAGALVAASAAALFFGVARVAGSALDVLLDVDNYLRQQPIEATPRAKIAERYVSLLRYISTARDDVTRRPAYDAIVIVAHSLGALITCDLLRFLTAETAGGRGDPTLAALGYGHKRSKGHIPIHLFTMGNPLRQLMNRFFPHQYHWVKAIPDNALRSAPEKSADPAIPEPPVPSPDLLGVASWSNAYRSGDYVGRAIWLDEWYARTNGPDGTGGYPAKLEVVARGEVSEMCIGLGAHTHYWDDSAPDVAEFLDRLIVSTCNPT